ncbi:MAG: hypothetical protein ABSB97_07350 [Thermoplasmata archaeon]|jgi:hypothetical protein
MEIAPVDGERRGTGRRLKWSPLAVIVTVVIIAGAAIAAGAAFYFLTPQTGTYQGPGLPVTQTISANLPSDGSYYSLGVRFNDTVATAWLNFSVSGETNATVEYGLMNQSQYGNLTNNTGISWLTHWSGDVVFNYHATLASTGPTIYLVGLATEADSKFVGSLTVTAYS